jgi:adenine phosphoribosyltransferase
MQLRDEIKASIREVEDYPKPGIIFKDITPVLAKPALVRDIISALVTYWKPMKLDAIAAVEARGFILGSILAHQLECSFIPIRKSGKLPYLTKRETYTLEYGTSTIEMHTDAVQPGNNVLIHDDLLATGGTAAAAGRLIKSSGGTIAGFSFLINLSFLPGTQNLLSEFGIAPNYLIDY